MQRGLRLHCSACPAAAAALGVGLLPEAATTSTKHVLFCAPRTAAAAAAAAAAEAASAAAASAASASATAASASAAAASAASAAATAAAASAAAASSFCSIMDMMRTCPVSDPTTTLRARTRSPMCSNSMAATRALVWRPSCSASASTRAATASSMKSGLRLRSAASVGCTLAGAAREAATSQCRRRREGAGRSHAGQHRRHAAQAQ